MSDTEAGQEAGAARQAAVTVSVLAALLGASHGVSAGEVGILAGSLNGYSSVSLIYRSAPLWQGVSAKHPLEVDLEYSLGMVRASDGGRDLARIGLTPFARWRFAAHTGVELGIGANVFSGTRLGDKDFSTAFQFGSSLGLFHRLQGTPWVFGLRLTHYSNAGIKRPNPGQEYAEFRVSYALP